MPKSRTRVLSADTGRLAFSFRIHLCALDILGQLLFAHADAWAAMVSETAGFDQSVDRRYGAAQSLCDLCNTEKRGNAHGGLLRKRSCEPDDFPSSAVAVLPDGVRQWVS